MHVKKRFAIIYSTIMCIVLLVVGKISCDSFTSYMGWDELFSVQREKE